MQNKEKAPENFGGFFFCAKDAELKYSAKIQWMYFSNILISENNMLLKIISL